TTVRAVRGFSAAGSMHWPSAVTGDAWQRRPRTERRCGIRSRAPPWDRHSFGDRWRQSALVMMTHGLLRLKRPPARGELGFGTTSAVSELETPSTPAANTRAPALMKPGDS